MNLIYGEVIDILTEDGMRFAKIRITGVLIKVPLELLTDVERGDTILVCDGVAISKVRPVETKRNNHVPRDPR